MSMHLPGGAAENVARTVRSPLIVTVHVELPEHPCPAQPRNIAPAEAEARSETRAPWPKSAAQVRPQAMPAGAEVSSADRAPIAVDPVHVIAVDDRPFGRLGPAMKLWLAAVPSRLARPIVLPRVLTQ